MELSSHWYDKYFINEKKVSFERWIVQGCNSPAVPQPSLHWLWNVSSEQRYSYNYPDFADPSTLSSIWKMSVTEYLGKHLGSNCTRDLSGEKIWGKGNLIDHLAFAQYTTAKCLLLSVDMKAKVLFCLCNLSPYGWWITYFAKRNIRQ